MWPKTTTSTFRSGFWRNWVLAWAKQQDQSWAPARASLKVFGTLTWLTVWRCAQVRWMYVKSTGAEMALKTLW